MVAICTLYSLDYEECAHKLLKNMEEGQEVSTSTPALLLLIVGSINDVSLSLSLPA